MSARSKTNNFVAILIAIILMAIGFALYFINEQSVAAREEAPAQAEEPITMSAEAEPEPDDALAEVWKVSRFTLTIREHHTA